jgi:hypothetical protein
MFFLTAFTVNEPADSNIRFVLSGNDTEISSAYVFTIFCQNTWRFFSGKTLILLYTLVVKIFEKKNEAELCNRQQADRDVCSASRMAGFTTVDRGSENSLEKRVNGSQRDLPLDSTVLSLVTLNSRNITAISNNGKYRITKLLTFRNLASYI